MPPLKIESLTRIKSPAARTGLFGASAVAPGLYENIRLSIVPSRLKRTNSTFPFSSFVPPARDMARFRVLPCGI